MSPRWLHWPAAGGGTVLVELTAQLSAWNANNQWEFKNESSSDSTIVDASGNNRWDIDDQWIRNAIGSGYADKDAFYLAYPDSYATITITSSGTDYTWTYTGQGTGFASDFQWTTTSGPTVAEAESGGTLGFAINDSVSVKVYES